MVSGEKVQEALVMLGKDDRTMTGRSYWRPNMYRDIRAAMESTNFGRRVSANSDTISNAAKEEFDIKVDYMKKNAKPLYKTLVSVQRDIMSTYEDVKADVINMYNQNEFHIKDICQWFKTTASWAK